jgi:hypothetical protein
MVTEDQAAQTLFFARKFFELGPKSNNKGYRLIPPWGKIHLHTSLRVQDAPRIVSSSLILRM